MQLQRKYARATAHCTSESNPIMPLGSAAINAPASTVVFTACLLGTALRRCVINGSSLSGVVPEEAR